MDDKTALVTGANKGIGFEIARGLSKQGMRVLLGCRSRENGEAAIKALAAEGRSATGLVLDVTQADTIAEAAREIASTYGRLDVLVNNAGISAEGRLPPSKTDLNRVRQVYDTNVFGVIAMTQAMLPLLLRSPSGRIVNVSSSLGSLGLTSDPDHPYSKFNLLGYNSSKSALNAITVQFANELRETPVKVNSVCPGYVATDLNGRTGPRTPEQGARIAIQMAMIDSDGPTGGFFNEDGRIVW
jgi:NAD(P)-dependent dehydrogenase (short-subunit alcohol dehydrogenase family)